MNDTAPLSALLPPAALAAIETVAAVAFVAALLHGLAGHRIGRLAERDPRRAALWHRLGEVEVAFVLWALVLLAAIAILGNAGAALAYARSRSYAEPMFVGIVMVMAAARPLRVALIALLHALARRLPMPAPVATVWLGLALVPLLGSLVTEPAAMTLAALLLAPLAFRPEIEPGPKYLALGTLFVNVSIGGTLTAYAAPPILMVASIWQWDSAFVLAHLGWKAAIAVALNATIATWSLRRALAAPALDEPAEPPRPPWSVAAMHVLLLAAAVACAHRPLALVLVFAAFLAYARWQREHQSRLIAREATLVGLFLAGLVVLGGLQRHWLEPLVSSMSPSALYLGAIALTAVTDNAALTYIGAQLPSLSEAAKVLLVAGAVAGGGLTVIANAPNPAGAALLVRGFAGRAIEPGRLLLGAALPTLIAALALRLP